MLPVASVPCNFYPRPPRGGRRAGKDHPESKRYFYPRPPRGGRRQPVLLRRRGAIFLSTPSARRATVVNDFTELPIFDFYPRPPRGGRPMLSKSSYWRRYFYPRPPRGGRPFDYADKIRKDRISIHALREEGDPSPFALCSLCRNFYPRPPRGGRLLAVIRPRCLLRISIHALREEGDM